MRLGLKPEFAPGKTVESFLGTIDFGLCTLVAVIAVTFSSCLLMKAAATRRTVDTIAAGTDQNSRLLPRIAHLAPQKTLRNRN